MCKRIKRFISLRKKRKAMMSAHPIIIENQTSVLDVQLLDKTPGENKKVVRQYTKKLITVLTTCACVWISLSYIMSAYALIVYADSNPLSSLSEKVCGVVIGTVITYAVKAWLESFSEKTITPFLLNDKEQEENSDDEIVG